MPRAWHLAEGDSASGAQRCDGLGLKVSFRTSAARSGPGSQRPLAERGFVKRQRHCAESRRKRYGREYGGATASRCRWRRFPAERRTRGSGSAIATDNVVRGVGAPAGGAAGTRCRLLRFAGAAKLERSLRYWDLVLSDWSYSAPCAPLPRWGFVWSGSERPDLMANVLGAVCMSFTSHEFTPPYGNLPTAGRFTASRAIHWVPLPGFHGRLDILWLLLIPACFTCLIAGWHWSLFAGHRSRASGDRMVAITHGSIGSASPVTSRANFNRRLHLQPLFWSDSYIGRDCAVCRQGNWCVDAQPLCERTPFRPGKIFSDYRFASCLPGFDAVSTLAEEVRAATGGLVAGPSYATLVLAAVFFVTSTLGTSATLLPVIAIKDASGARRLMNWRRGLRVLDAVVLAGPRPDRRLSMHCDAVALAGWCSPWPRPTAAFRPGASRIRAPTRPHGGIWSRLLVRGRWPVHEEPARRSSLHRETSALDGFLFPCTSRGWRISASSEVAARMVHSLAVAETSPWRNRRGARRVLNE